MLFSDNINLQKGVYDFNNSYKAKILIGIEPIGSKGISKDDMKGKNDL